MACLVTTLATPAIAATAATGGTTVATGGTTAPTGTAIAPPAGLGGAAPIAGTASRPNTLLPPAGGARVNAVTLIRGNLTPGQVGRQVALQLFDAARGWLTVGTAKAAAGGAFAIGWRPLHLGRFVLRAVVAGKGTLPGLSAAIEVYRSVVATLFGPGSYGSRTACGQTLTPELVGVAHRTLPCGTMVDISYGNTTISVPVVDRGPFVSGISYDLTMAAAAQLGAVDTVRIGAVAIHGPASAAF